MTTRQQGAAELAAAIDNLVILRDLALDLVALQWSGDLAVLEDYLGHRVDMNEVLGETTAALLAGERATLRRAKWDRSP